ncbi:MAG: ribonuclease PH [Chloroflexi bacterium]|nr:MAG: ribonuclease PH [Chloroflexota bacterium]
MRIDGRQPDQLRPVSIIPNYIIFPEGSVLISFGNTRVLCNTTIEESVPRWIQNQGVVGGWLTAEYALLPRSTHTRTPRETNGLGGRTQEIRRLVGRSLRAALDLTKLGQRTITIDCDVLQADGGTRTAAITGGYVSMSLAVQKLINAGSVPPEIFLSPVAAVSVGIVAGVPMLDLNYAEDSKADVDVNVVMNGSGEFIEVQGTAEGKTFPRSSLNILLDLAASGINQLIEIQKSALA